MKNKKIIIIFAIFFLILIGTVPTLGRYIGNEIKNYYLSSKNFYFNSDKLEPNGIVYQVENWSGVDSYSVTFNMNSYKNNTVYSETDIEYEITYSCSSNVTCTITKEQSVIYATEHIDSFTVTITPIKPLEDNDKATINVEAKSTSPYEKTLKGTFNVVVGKMGLNYEIIDEPSSTYFEVSITNTLDYYTVREAFNDYPVGYKIDIDEYLSLSEENKNKCASSIATINFDPNVVLLDMTTTAYLESISTTNTVIDNFSYINGLSFKIEAQSSYRVKFYKVDSSKDYTYPFKNENSIVNIRFD